MTQEQATCPGCGEPKGKTWLGVVVREVYDGVLYWTCEKCGIAWSRNWHGYGRRGEIAQRYVDQHNTARAEA